MIASIFFMRFWPPLAEISFESTRSRLFQAGSVPVFANFGRQARFARERGPVGNFAPNAPPDTAFD
ncbi:MAG TPA: hypothetical protein VMF90_26320 [Rhizobiaceae bacterium]|nr:hypothetical protein [Rhizobiaceae bacterium]